MEMKFFVLFVRFFPFFAIVTNSLNFLIVRQKMNSATKKFLIYSTGSMFVWGMLQLLGGYDNCFFVLLPPWEHPLVVVFWVLYFAGVWGFAAWMMLGENSGQVPENEKRDSDDGTRKKRIEVLGFAVMGSVFPVMVLLGHLTGFIEQMGLETMFEGFNIPWP